MPVRSDPPPYRPDIDPIGVRNGHSIRDHLFPLVLGGDCSILVDLIADSFGPL